MPNHPLGGSRLGESQPMMDGQRLLGQALTLQLPFRFEVRALSDRLVSSTPE
jgi:hypothetical protein